ncbi:MAG: PDZ domain-containing protein, partial [Kiritimatiellae bacterium]|nr:PDZ domain-containing protein [Kiritimatiellia bacterium]
ISRVYNYPEGVFVDRVIEGSAAEKAGIQRGDIIIHRLIEKPFLGDCSWRDYARYFTANNTLGALWVFNLLADGRCHAGSYELREIRIKRVIGNAAHRLTAALRKRRTKNRGRYDCVLAEHFIKIAKTKHEYSTFRNLSFKRDILPHHWCQFFCHLILLQS